MKASSRFLLIFFYILLIRVLLAAFMYPGADEAYYYVYTLNPALSYFDHPPMVALAGWLGTALTGWTTPLTLRLVPLILFAPAVYFFYLLCARYMEKRAAFVSTAVFTSVPMFFIPGALILPDAPLIFFWVLALYIFKSMVIDRTSLRGWILFGAAAGAGMLSKYTAVFLLAGAFAFIASDPGRRKQFLTPGPYIAALTALAVFSPVLFWNAANGFASFSFHSGRVGVAAIRWRYFYQSFFGQMGYLLPFFFFPALYFAVKSVLKFRENELSLFTAAFGSVPLFVFLGASLFRRVLPHWPIIAYISLAPAVGVFFDSLLLRRRKLFITYASIHLTLCGAAAAAVILQINTGFLMNRPLAESGAGARSDVRDITIELTGWELLPGFIDRLGTEEVFLFTHRWELGGQVAFAVRGEYPVLCLNSVNRARGFAFWQDQEAMKGRDGIFISTSRYFRDPAETYAPYFSSIEFIGEIPVERSGVTVKKIYLFRCRDFSGGFPVF